MDAWRAHVLRQNGWSPASRSCVWGSGSVTRVSPSGRSARAPPARV